MYIFIMAIEAGDLVIFENTSVGKTFCHVRGTVDVIVEEGTVGIVTQSWEGDEEECISPDFEVMVGEDLIAGIDTDDLIIDKRKLPCLCLKN